MRFARPQERWTGMGIAEADRQDASAADGRPVAR